MTGVSEASATDTNADGCPVPNHRGRTSRARSNGSFQR